MISNQNKVIENLQLTAEHIHCGFPPRPRPKPDALR